MSQPHKILPTKTKQFNEMRSTLEGYERRELANKERITQLEAALKVARDALRKYDTAYEYKDSFIKTPTESKWVHHTVWARQALATLGELLGENAKI